MNKKIFSRIIPLLIIWMIASFSCDKNGYKYEIGSFPDTPTNLSDFNTEFDDYNSTAPSLGETFPLCFSSTRNSNGLNYDIVYKLMSIDFSKTSGTLNVSENTSSNLDVYIENANINNALRKVNTPFDEFGPYLIPQGRNYDGTNINGRFETYIFLYSSNSNGNQDIMFTQNLNNENYENPTNVSFLNSDFDDAYPTFNRDNSEIYFTSNREGASFNIYKAKLDNSNEIIDMLSDNSPVSIEMEMTLSTDYDDKCPFISGNIMVFASNRVGGFGGYDLYYSLFVDGNWSEPINFGASINTEFDEYRPIVRPQWDFSNDFMIFSSNRPGGKGGFDLYYVGIDKINDL